LGLNETLRTKLTNLLAKNSDVFYHDGQQSTVTDLIEHTIEISNHSPIKQPAYRIPHSQRQIVKENIEQMLAQKIIQPSNSAWSSPIVLAKKKDNTTRFCVDYRRLNNITSKDTYPMPNVSDIFDHIGRSSVFSTLDLQRGFWQIPVRESDRPKTAFTTFTGLYEFCVMPFGLTNSPATFQRLIENVLRDLTGANIFIYMDDVLIASETIDQHVDDLQRVFDRMRSAHLQLNFKKCTFGRPEVIYLGHAITKNGLSPDKAKVNAVKNFPTPTDIKSLKGFLGLASYYRRFIDSFATIANPLFKLLRKNVSFNWTSSTEKAFNNLKSRLISAPVLAYPDFNKPFILHTDASGTGIGGILSQETETGERPIAFISRSLNKAERNYATTEQEALAIVWSLKTFRPYVYGHPCILYTDHAPLRFLTSSTLTNSRLIRWSLSLQDYTLEIRYKSGSTNQAADALSRNPVFTVLSEDSIVTEQINDKFLGPICDYLKNGTISPDPEFQRKVDFFTSHFLVIDNKLYYQKSKKQTPNSEAVLAVPASMVNYVIEEFHDSLFSAHLGFKKTLDKLQQRFYWPKMASDIFIHCRSCLSCAGRKAPAAYIHAPLVPITVAECFELVAMDILGPFPTTETGNKYVIVFCEYLTRWPEAFAIPDAKAETVARVFVDNIVCRYGAPKRLLSDRGANFLSDTMKEICRICQTTKVNTVAYHPQCDGLVERFNRSLAEMLSMYVSTSQRDWDFFIPYVLLAYRTSKHESTGFSPFYLLYGRQARLPIDSALNSTIITKYIDTEDYITTVTTNLTEAWKLAKITLGKSQARQKKQYDTKLKPPKFQIGDTVLLYRPVVPVGKSSKLTPKWKGPFVIKDLQMPNAKIEDVRHPGSAHQTVHVNQLKKYWFGLESEEDED